MTINNDSPSNGRMLATGRPEVDAMLESAVRMAQTYTEDEFGDLRAIDDQEYAQLCDMVGELSCEDRQALDSYLPVWTRDHGAAYAVVVDSLRREASYDQFLGTLAAVQANRLYLA